MTSSLRSVWKFQRESFLHLSRDDDCAGDGRLTSAAWQGAMGTGHAWAQMSALATSDTSDASVVNS